MLQRIYLFKKAPERCFTRQQTHTHTQVKIAAGLKHENKEHDTLIYLLTYPCCLWLSFLVTRVAVSYDVAVLFRNSEQL